MYLATDQGVYSSASPYGTWSVYGTGLPNVQVRNLQLSHTLGQLAAATHGRGVWEIQLPSVSGP